MLLVFMQYPAMILNIIHRHFLIDNTFCSRNVLESSLNASDNITFSELRMNLRLQRNAGYVYVNEGIV
jgi:hypothetical protein